MDVTWSREAEDVARFVRENSILKEICDEILKIFSCEICPQNIFAVLLKFLRRTYEKEKSVSRVEQFGLKAETVFKTLADPVWRCFSRTECGSMFGFEFVLRKVKVERVLKYRWVTSQVAKLLEEHAGHGGADDGEDGCPVQSFVALIGQAVFDGSFYGVVASVALRVHFVVHTSKEKVAQRKLLLVLIKFLISIEHSDHHFLLDMYTFKNEEGRWIPLRLNLSELMSHRDKWMDVLMKTMEGRKTISVEVVFSLDESKSTFKPGKIEFFFSFVENEGLKRTHHFTESPLSTMAEGIFMERSHMEMFAKLFFQRDELCKDNSGLSRNYLRKKMKLLIVEKCNHEEELWHFLHYKLLLTELGEEENKLDLLREFMHAVNSSSLELFALQTSNKNIRECIYKFRKVRAENVPQKILQDMSGEYLKQLKTFLHIDNIQEEFSLNQCIQKYLNKSSWKVIKPSIKLVTLLKNLSSYLGTSYLSSLDQFTASYQILNEKFSNEASTNLNYTTIGHKLSWNEGLLHDAPLSLPCFVHHFSLAEYALKMNLVEFLSDLLHELFEMKARKCLKPVVIGLCSEYAAMMELEIKHSQDNKQNLSKSEFDENKDNSEKVDNHQFIVSPSLLRKLPFSCEAKGKGSVSEWLSRDLLDEVIGAVRKHIISRGNDRQTSFQTSVSNSIKEAWYLLGDPYLSTIHWTEHYFITGPGNPFLEALHFYASIVRDDLLSNYANDEILVGGVLFGDEDNPGDLRKIFWNIHEIIENENDFVLVFEQFLMKKEPIEIKFFIENKGDLVELRKKLLLTYISHPDQKVKQFFRQHSWSENLEIFLDQDQVIWQEATSKEGPSDDGKPLNYEQTIGQALKTGEWIECCRMILLKTLDDSNENESLATEVRTVLSSSARKFDHLSIIASTSRRLVETHISCLRNLERKNSTSDSIKCERTQSILVRTFECLKTQVINICSDADIAPLVAQDIASKLSSAGEDIEQLNVKVLMELDEILHMLINLRDVQASYTISKLPNIKKQLLKYMEGSNSEVDTNT